MSFLGSKDWDFNSVATSGILGRIRSFFSTCLREPISPTQVETIIRFFLSMFVMTMIVYIIYFTVVKPKFSSEVTNQAIELIKNKFIDNMVDNKTTRPYITNMPYDVLLKLSKNPDPYYTSYNGSITTTFSVIFAFIGVLLLLSIFIANNILCIDYSLLSILSENIAIYSLISIASLIFFMYYIQRYKFTYPLDTANIFIDRLIHNAANFK